MKIKYKRGSAREAKSIEHKKLNWVEERFGVVCIKCGKRRGTFIATRSAEGGRDNVCECDE